MTDSAKPWADTPFPLISETGRLKLPEGSVPDGHSCVATAVNMAAAHNCLLRAINAAYNQADGVMLAKDAGDLGAVQAFLVFNQCHYDALSHHHSVEARVFFPAIAELTGNPKFCEAELSQHQAFHDGGEAFKAYVYGTKPEDFDAKTFKDLLQAFGHALQEHLHSEMNMLLSLRDYDSDKLVKANALTVQEASKGLDPLRGCPLVSGCQEIAFPIDGEPYDSWEEPPWFIRHLSKWVMYWRHRSAWQFCPCDMDGVRKPLKYT